MSHTQLQHRSVSLLSLPLEQTCFHFFCFHTLCLRAACVQILLNQNFCVSDSAYALLLASAPQDAPLFPKLRSLGWYDSCVASIPALNLLLPTIDTLALDISNAPFRKAIFQNLRTASPRLTLATSELELLLLSYPEGLIQLSIRFFYDDISNGWLEAIAIGFKSMPLHVPQPFQALTDLHMSCEDLSLFTSLLCSIQRTDPNTSRCPNLKRTDIITRRCSPASIWMGLLALLTHTKLEHISIVEKCNYERISKPSPSPPPTTCSLYSLMASQHTCIPGALGYIMRRCRELCEVSLCVDARLNALGTAPLDDDEQVRLQPNRRLMKLDIGESPIALDLPTVPDLMMSIPRFLHMIAPRLAELKISLELYFEWTRQTEMETRSDMERWEKVEDALSELA
ncbi:hypothetical protein EV702DRAFT_1235052 [Suillus placidus]|uniref:Uncharacterized protein n=1 Tax=Suillus placidus TaxID=48579 RepID=A0A9P6ZSK7_9AGAM|nr:hypothetical protein EV702DRAFT_1235052 [Suillus placidus]